MSTSDTDQIPLSFNQEFLCMFDKGDEEGPFGPRYNIVCGWRVIGRIDVDVLQAALGDLVARHEALRTRLVRAEGNRHQEVLAPRPAELQVREFREVEPGDRQRRAEELIIELETGSYSVTELPLIRGVLGRFDEQDAVLVLIAHHSAADEWSMKVAALDLARLYAARRGHDTELPEVPQYRDYAVWDRARSASPAMARSRRYWQDKLRGARIVPTRTDTPRSAGLAKGTAAHRFLIGAAPTSAALAFARQTRSSPFMVLLAAYQVFLSRTSGATDITVTTLMSGRTQARFDETIGSFFNLTPLRTDISGARTFRDVIEGTRRTCIEAYSRDVPFGQILQDSPEIGAAFEGDGSAVLSFQVLQYPYVMDQERIGDLEFSDLQRRLLSQPVTTDIPDGGLWTLDITSAGDIAGSLWYNTNLFTGRTIQAMTENFRRVLEDLVALPDAPLVETS